MPESSEAKANSLTEVLLVGVRELRKEPALLAAVLVTIVLLLVAVWAPGSVGVVAWPLVALLGVGSAAWLVHDVRRQGSDRPRLRQRISMIFSRIEAGRDVTIGGQDIHVDAGEPREEERAERRQ